MPPRVVRDDLADAGMPGVLDHGRDGLHVHGRGRKTRAEGVPAALAQDGVGARHGQEQRHPQRLRLPGRRQRHVAADHAARGRDAFPLHQGPEGADGLRGVVPVVPLHELHRPAQDPAGLVELRDRHAHPVPRVHPPEGERAAEGTQEGHLEGPGLRSPEARQEPQRQEQRARACQQTTSHLHHLPSVLTHGLPRGQPPRWTPTAAGSDPGPLRGADQVARAAGTPAASRSLNRWILPVTVLGRS
ncbi:hypothetical protein HRbin32_02003 [bacterium HR32]|nr:hypothetical protein HRbin32_02003 [bacterium HR32]